MKPWPNDIDDDANGYIDDVHGWDFCNNDNSVHDRRGLARDARVGHHRRIPERHGPLGVAPGIAIMALKFIDDGNLRHQGRMAVDAIDYAASFGVGIINASWGGPEPSAVLDVAIAASGRCFVAAAGNERLNLDGDGHPGERSIQLRRPVQHPGGRSN